MQAFVMKVAFQVGDGNLSEVEDAGGKGSVGLSDEEGVAEVFFPSCPTAGDNGNGERFRQLP